jgi:hypothetical protein
MLNYVHHCLIENSRDMTLVKTLIQVSIDLGLREKEASKLFSEFLRLKGQGEVYEIYFENKHYLKSLRKLHRLLKREGVTVDKIE